MRYSHMVLAVTERAGEQGGGDEGDTGGRGSVPTSRDFASLNGLEWGVRSAE